MAEEILEQIDAQQQAEEQLENTTLQPDSPQTPQDVLDKIQQPGFLNLLYLGGLIETVTSIPTHTPSRFEQQVKIYVDSVTSPSVKRVYIYSNQTNAWYYADISGLGSLSSPFTLGESLSANDAVIVASGFYVSNTITQTSQDADFDVYGTNWVGQTFTTSASTVALTGFTIRLQKNGTFNTSHHIMFKATSGGLPTGDNLIDVTDLASSFSAFADEYTYTFSTPLTVSPSTTYAIIVDFFHGDSGGNHMACYYKGSSVYAGGTYFSTTDSGSNWTADANKDLYFKIYESYHTAGRIYKANGTADNNLADGFAGFVTAAGSAGDTKNVKVAGVVSGFSSLSKGKRYYLSTSSGLISTTKSFPYSVGLAVSDTEVLIQKFLDPVAVTASDNLRTSADTEGTFTSSDSSTYVLKKSVRAAYTGTYRVKFDMKGNADFTSYGRIYKDGSAYGTEQSIAAPSSTFQTFSEDLYFKEGELIQLYVKTSNTYSLMYRNFRLYYDRTIPSGDTIITN